MDVPARPVTCNSEPPLRLLRQRRLQMHARQRDHAADASSHGNVDVGWAATLPTRTDVSTRASGSLPVAFPFMISREAHAK